MRLARTAVAVAAVAVGVLALGACDGNTGGASPDASRTSAPAGATDTTPGDSGTATGGAATTGTGTSTDSGARTGASGTAGGSASGNRCHTGDLGYSWATGGDAVPDGDSTKQQQAHVMLKNTSGHTCSMHGFPGVDLVNSGQQWSLRRTSQSPTTLTLHPGDTTQFTVTFLPWNAEGNAASNNFAPTTLVITPPNETTSYDIPWRWGHVLLQDGATHPGTFISPIGD
jgi:Protein of unknown function (DUF4232)